MQFWIFVVGVLLLIKEVRAWRLRRVINGLRFARGIGGRYGG